jgi:hypothetical protein
MTAAAYPIPNYKQVISFSFIVMSKLLPLKIGAILKTPSPPIVSICPSANSIKNMGIPARISVMKYGIYRDKKACSC